MHITWAAAGPLATNFIFLPVTPFRRYGSGKLGYASCRAISACNTSRNTYVCARLILPDTISNIPPAPGGFSSWFAMLHDVLPEDQT